MSIIPTPNHTPTQLDININMSTPLLHNIFTPNHKPPKRQPMVNKISIRNFNLSNVFFTNRLNKFFKSFFIIIYIKLISVRVMNISMTPPTHNDTLI